MESVSATWTQLPPKLLAPVMDGVLTLAEAAWLWDLFLEHQGQWFHPPRQLQPAVDRLRLWQMEADATKH